MLQLFRHRTPPVKELLSVFAVTVFTVYTWTMYVSFWYIPSWLMFLDMGSILSIYAYAFLTSFLESALLLFFAFVPLIVLPARWWRKKFVPKGIAFVLILVLSAQVHFHLYSTPDVQDMLLSGQLTWWVITLVLAFFLSWMTGRFAWMENLLVQVADRLKVFLYIYLPLTAFSVILILVRIFL